MIKSPKGDDSKLEPLKEVKGFARHSKTKLGFAAAAAVQTAWWLQHPPRLEHLCVACKTYYCFFARVHTGEWCTG